MRRISVAKGQDRNKWFVVSYLSQKQYFLLPQPSVCLCDVFDRDVSAYDCTSEQEYHLINQAIIISCSSLLDLDVSTRFNQPSGQICNLRLFFEFHFSDKRSPQSEHMLTVIKTVSFGRYGTSNLLYLPMSNLEERRRMGGYE